jgi:hypothetical protein
MLFDEGVVIAKVKSVTEPSLITILVGADVLYQRPLKRVRP